jgi:hypothetical protein
MMKKMSNDEFRSSIRRNTIIIPKPKDYDNAGATIVASALLGYINLVELDSPLPERKFYGYYQSVGQLAKLEDFADDEVIEEPVGALWILKDGSIVLE